MQCIPHIYDHVEYRWSCRTEYIVLNRDSFTNWSRYTELRNGPTCKMGLASSFHFDVPVTRRYSSMPNIGPSLCRRLLRVMRPISGCSLLPPRRRIWYWWRWIDSDGFGQDVKWPYRNGHDKIWQSKVLLLYFVGQQGNSNDPPKSRSRRRLFRRHCRCGRPAVHEFTDPPRRLSSSMPNIALSQFALLQPTSRTSWHEFRSRRPGYGQYVLVKVKTDELNLTCRQQCTRVCCRSLQ